MSTISLDGRTIFVTDEGAGSADRAVVMLHGLGGTTSMFQPQAPVLAEKARVVRIDLAGSGLSTYDPATGPLGVAGWADDVVGVLDALGVGRATFVAHSLGTLVAAEIAVRHPGRVDRIVALGPVRAQPETVKAATRERAATVRAGGMETVVDAVVGVAVSERAKQQEPLVATFVHASLLAQEPQGYAASCEALAAAEEPRWGDIAAPVWLVGGTGDRLSTPETADAIEALLPDVRRVRVPDAGHWLSIEEPELVTQVVRDAITS